MVLVTVFPGDLKMFPLTVKCHGWPLKCQSKADVSTLSASPISGPLR